MFIRKLISKQTELSAQPESQVVVISTTTISTLTIFTDEPAPEETPDSENDSATELVSSIEEESSLSDVITTESDDETEEETDLTHDRIGALMLMKYPADKNSLKLISGDVASKLQDVGDNLAAKNKQRYEVVAKMNAYPSVLAARRAEVDAMLDAGNQKEYRATQGL